MRSEAFRKGIIRVIPTPDAKSAPFRPKLSCTPLRLRFALLTCLHHFIIMYRCVVTYSTLGNLAIFETRTLLRLRVFASFIYETCILLKLGVFWCRTCVNFFTQKCYPHLLFYQIIIDVKLSVAVLHFVPSVLLLRITPNKVLH